MNTEKIIKDTLALLESNSISKETAFELINEAIQEDLNFFYNKIKEFNNRIDSLEKEKERIKSKSNSELEKLILKAILLEKLLNRK